MIVATLIFLTANISATNIEVSTQQDWNDGTFSGTSADRNDNSGSLGLGYINGTSSDSLVGYWQFDRSVSGSGGTVKDYSGNGNDGTARNGVNTGTQGVFSTSSFDFDGTDDYVALDKSFSCGDCFPKGLTVSFWFKRTGIGSNGPDRVGPTFDRSEYFSFIVDSGWTNNNDQMVFSVSDDQGVHDLFSQNPIPLDEWHLWTGVWSPSDGKMYLYKDGELVGSQNSGNNLGSGKTRYGFLNAGSEASSFDGQKNGDHSKGPIDEVRIYNQALASTEVKKLYLDGKAFSGNYNRSIQNSESTKWDKVEVDASSIPAGTDVGAVFKAKDSSDKVVDEQVIDLQEGKNNYSLDVADSEKAEIMFNGSSSDVTKSWTINGFKVFTGFCDFRGPKNECIMNSTRQLQPQTYDVNSIFESRSTAVFEAFSGTSILNISNSSRLSGFWRGSFEIRSNPVTVEPGASFRPRNGRIIIGQ